MKIAIDISQLAYPNTGVSNYLESLVCEMVKDESKEFVLFFSSLRINVPRSMQELAKRRNVTIKAYKFPPLALHAMWNTIHKLPIEKFVGNVDLFLSSDWTEPPAKKAMKATILYDLIVYKYPEETHSQTEFSLNKLRLSSNIVKIQKKKLSWVKKESDVIFCISEATKRDAVEILGLDKNKLRVIYPGATA